MNHKHLRLPFGLVALCWPLYAAQASGWYFQESCTDECADFFDEYSNEPIGDSAWTEGPFFSEDECLRARDIELDDRALLFFTESDGWYIGPCYWVGDEAPNDTTTSSKSKGAPLLSKIQVGYQVGPGWTIEEASGQSYEGESTQGIELGLRFGGPSFGVEGALGFQTSRFHSPLFGPVPISYGAVVPFVPVSVGVSASPFLLYQNAKVEVRPSVGASLAAVSTWGCHFVSSCTPEFKALSSEFGARFTLGVDVFFGKKKVPGLGFDVLFPVERLGDFDDILSPNPMEAYSPPFLLRFSVLLRNQP